MANGNVTTIVSDSKAYEKDSWDLGPELYDEARSRFVKSPDRSFNQWLRRRRLGTLARAREALTGASKGAAAMRIIRAVEREFGITINRAPGSAS